VIRLVFLCDGAAGHARLGECQVARIVILDGYGIALFTDAVDVVKEEGWTFRRFGEKFIVRCPKCEALKVKRRQAQALRERLKRERTG
jgi:hypothetical protein